MGEAFAPTLIVAAALFAMAFALGWRRERNWVDLAKIGKYGADVAREVSKEAEKKARASLVKWGVAGALGVAGLITSGVVAVEYAPLLAPMFTANMSPTIYEIDVGPDASGEIPPDQVWDWGDFADAAAMQADSLITSVVSTAMLAIVDTVPAVSDYGEVYNGSVRWLMTSQDSIVPGWQISIPNGCNQLTLGACPGGTIAPREVWERFYILYRSAGSGYTLEWPNCVSGGSTPTLKHSLFGPPGISGNARADITQADGEYQIPFGGEDWRAFPIQVNTDTLGLSSGQDAWHKIERHIKHGDSITGAEGLFELWVNDVPSHDTLKVDSLSGPTPVDKWFDIAGILNTYNCEEEMFAQPAGDSISIYWGPHELWWEVGQGGSGPPLWWDTKPATQKLGR